MATKVILPKLGQTMEEGTIVEWLVKEGDAVKRGDILFTVESDKAVLEVESRSKGVMRKILVQPGANVPVLSLVAIIAKEDEDIGALVGEEGATEAPAASTEVVIEEDEQPPADEATPQSASQVPAPAAREPVAITHEGGRIFSSPRARKLAREERIDLALIAGSGPEGRIVEKDVKAFVAGQPAATPLARKLAQELGISLAAVQASGARISEDDVRAAAVAPAPAALAAAAPVGALAVPVLPPPAEGQLTPVSGVRAVTAERMAASSHTTAAVTLQSEVEATAFVELRTQLKSALADELGFNVGYNDLLAKIVARCLVELPFMNVRLEEGGIRHLDHVNVGLAVDTERGLIVPVLRDADQMDIKTLARTFRELVDKGRKGRLGIDDMTGGTFTITNLGMFGVDQFTPVINLPECAILGVGRIKAVPAVVDGQIVARQRMWLSFTFDHRLVDGAPAARFFQAIVHYIEQPYLLLT